MADTFKTIPLADIYAADDNLRSQYTDITELATSIDTFGLIEPIRVKKTADRYVILAGHRRFEAIKQLGWTETKAVVQSSKADDSDRTAVMLIENMQRVDLSIREQVEGVRRLVQEHGMSQSEVAASLGMTKKWVSDRVTMLNVPEEAWTKDPPLSVEHLVMLGKLPDDYQERLVKRERVTNPYDIEDYASKAANADRYDKFIRKARKAGVLVITEPELKKLMKADYDSTSGDDQVIKSIIGPAETIVSNSWEKPQVPAVRLTAMFGTLDSVEQKILEETKGAKVFVAAKVGGRWQWHTLEYVSPIEREERDDDDHDAYVEAQAEHKAACFQAEVDFVNDAKPADITKVILLDKIKKASSGWNCDRYLAHALALLGIEAEEVDVDSVDDRAACRERNAATLLGYAEKSGPNLARAALAADLAISNRLHSWDIEYPEFSWGDDDAPFDEEDEVA